MILKLALPIIYVLILAGCSGGSQGTHDVTGSETSPLPPTESPLSNNEPVHSQPVGPYNFITPILGQKSTYSESDDGGTPRTYTFTVNNVSVDGTFSTAFSSESWDATVGDYSYTNYFDNMGKRISSDLSWRYGDSNCTWSPNGDGIPSPLTVGQSWEYTDVAHCIYPSSDFTNSTASDLVHSGTYLGTETIAVPAGTFLAHKFARLKTSKQRNAIVIEHITTWLNASGADTRLIKESIEREAYFTEGLPPKTTVRVLDSFN